MEVRQALIIEFREVFPDEEPKSLAEYLTGISRSKLLDAATHFLGTNVRSLDVNSLEAFLQEYFRPDNRAMKDYLRAMLQPIVSSLNVVMVHPASMLSLFEYCFENLDENSTQSGQEAEINIFKAIFALNQLITSKEPIAGSSTKHIPGNLQLACMLLCQTYPYKDILEFDPIESFTCQVIKATYLFEFLENYDTTRILLAKFLPFFNCTNWQEYLCRLMPPIMQILEPDMDGKQEIVISRDQNFECTCTFLRKFTFTNFSPQVDIDYIEVRNAPFYESVEGRFTVIFSIFLIEKIFKSLYYKLEDVYKGLSEEERKALLKEFKIGDFRSFFCDYFSEKHLFYNVLNSIYKTKSRTSLTGEECREQMQEGEPDYYTRHGSSVLVFESKDIRINKEIKASFDFSRYEPAFREKLYYKEKNGQPKPKAVKQLVSNIRLVLEKSLPFDKDYESQAVNIYPVIILHDYQYNVLGLNYLVNDWFNRELRELRKRGLSTDKVRPVTIIDIDTVILFRDELKNETFLLEDMIDNYHTSIRPYENHSTHAEWIKHYMPFSHFALSSYPHVSEPFLSERVAMLFQ